MEETGTSGAFKLFCTEIGPSSPDMAGAARRITPAEFSTGTKRGVQGLTELKIGFGGAISVTNRPAALSRLTPAQLYKALAAQVPVGGKLVANPNKRWSDITPFLPATAIQVYGPAAGSGTREALVAEALVPACEAQAKIKKLADVAAKTAACMTPREDGVWRDMSGAVNGTISKVAPAAGALSIVSFATFVRNADKVKAVAVDGVLPSVVTILNGNYPLSHPLFLYVKNQQVGQVPGIREFIAAFTSDSAWGPNGYLDEAGLVALPDAERKGSGGRCPQPDRAQALSVTCTPLAPQPAPGGVSSRMVFAPCDACAGPAPARPQLVTSTTLPFTRRPEISPSALAHCSSGKVVST